MTVISRKNVPFKKQRKLDIYLISYFPTYVVLITDLSPFHLQPDKNCDPV